MSKVLQEPSLEKGKPITLVECHDDKIEKVNKVEGVDYVKVVPFDEGHHHVVELEKSVVFKE